MDKINFRSHGNQEGYQGYHGPVERVLGFGLGVEVFTAELRTSTAAKPQGHPLRVQGDMDAIPYTR